ncbi:hypothetical protein BU26DRAFT_536001 [Trematosphaeria pertusa]|uniref:EKC/KEOPS complex subunit BUD32 n=1 Tax=Trematosphaeria pertusa TaxID=390896 RepID=A0A6A6HQH7_9PLEO|nr:uncharacterized protein BU26DRAFT_536001 [Trematosphaeria pertusa]KAF2240267.1 hypothetical protein BU26DRAFT_536001 [Trematosphaeria pertusa]
MVYWYEDGTDTEKGQCVRIWDVPGTLSGDILRLRRNLPQRKCHFEIDGDTIRALPEYLEPREPIDDSEDISELVASLPLVEVDKKRHFVKKGTYRSEIRNLLACQGGECPGQPLSQHIIQLLGRSDKGELVFEKMSTRPFILPQFSDLATYKRWLLHLLDALQTLHSLGIVHRDIRVENVVFSRDGKRLVVCDLEEHWGVRNAPELVPEVLDAGWSPESDVYDIGHFIECMVYANAPLTRQVEWPVPAPLDAIVAACMCEVPEDRPTVKQLRAMVEAIETDAEW